MTAFRRVKRTCKNCWFKERLKGEKCFYQDNREVALKGCCPLHQTEIEYHNSRQDIMVKKEIKSLKDML